MKILEINELKIPEIKTIKFARFHDHRGYFTEQFRKSDLFNRSELNSMKGINFVQANQSYSKKGTIRGMHFQWNPYMGKMVRTLSGHMVDLILDIRKGSPNYGKMIAFGFLKDLLTAIFLLKILKLNTCVQENIIQIANQEFLHWQKILTGLYATKS